MPPHPPCRHCQLPVQRGEGGASCPNPLHGCHSNINLDINPWRLSVSIRSQGMFCVGVDCSQETLYSFPRLHFFLLLAQHRGWSMSNCTVVRRRSLVLPNHSTYLQT